MAEIDFSVPQDQYDKMIVVLNGIRAKLAANKVVLTRVLSQENGHEKVRAFAQTDAGRWLREVKRARDDLNKFFDKVGWQD